MKEISLSGEGKNRTIGAIISIITHVLIILLAVWPLLSYKVVPLNSGSVLVSFATAEEESPNMSAEAPSQETTQESVKEPEEKTSNESPPQNTDISNPAPPQEESDVTSSEEKENQAAIEAERKREEAERIAAEEAKRKAEEQARFEENKSKFNDLLKGENEAGNASDEEGNPDESVLEDISTGSTKVGGGLSNRGVLFEPDITDNSQATGIVVLKICVGKDGKVTEAKYTQRGSTTTDKRLIDIAINGARKYLFTLSEIETQCGTITIDFRLR